MNLDFDSLTDAEIIGVIRRAGAVPKKGEIRLQRYPTNPSRKDSQRRMSFRVWVDNDALIHLVVGRGQAPLHRRAVAFHRHNPDIAVRPLFSIQHAGVDFIGQECPGLFNLDEALTARRIDVAGWQQAVMRVATRLSITTEASTPAQLMQELAEFEDAVLAIPSFARIDMIFLRDTVFPLIRQEASRLQPATAWTNGDFIARNIVLDASGLPRLVDYEFARRTHFPQADWFRLQHFSTIPAGLQLESLGAPVPLPTWLEIRCWLDHALKMEGVCAPAIVQADLPKISARLVQLVESATTVRSHSVFFDLADGTAARPGGELADFSETLQVEWSAHGPGPFKAEPAAALRPNEWSEVQVDLSSAPGRNLQLRLRLPASPCVLELRSVEVYGRDRSQVLWTVDSPQLDKVLACSGNLLDLPTAEGLGIIHFGGEAHVTLPPLRLTRATPTVGLALWVRYVPDLFDFAQRLRRAFAAGDMPAFLTDVQPLVRIEGGDATTPKPVTAQLFVPDGPNYSEEGSFRLAIPGINVWTELAFDIPPLPEGAVLRFDPTDQPGLLEIASLTLEPLPQAPAGPAGRRRLRSLLEAINCEGDALLLPDDEGKQVLIFGDDPILKLAPLPADLASRSCRMTVSFRFLTSVPVSLWAHALQDQNRAIIDFNVRLHTTSLQTEAVRAELQRKFEEESAGRGRGDVALGEARAEAAGLKTELTFVQAELTRHQEAGLAATTEAQALRGKLAEAEKGHAAEVEQQRLELTQLRSTLETTENQRSASEQLARDEGGKLERIQHELAEARAQAQREEPLHRQTVTALASALAEIERLRAELVGSQASAAAARMEAARVVASLEQKAAQIAQELAASRNEATQTSAQLTRAELAGKSAEEQLAQAQAETAEANRRLERESQEKHQALAALTGTQADRERLLQETAGLATARRDGEQREQELASQLNRLEQQVRAGSSRELQLLDQLEELARSNRTLATSLTGTKASLNDLTARYDSLLDSLHAQNSHLLDLEQNAGLLSAERDALSAELKGALARVDKLTNAINEAGQRLLIRLDVKANRALKEAAQAAPASREP